MAPIASVVIPAHNEGAVLARSLQRLLSGSAPGELDVVVVPNGCSDQTAEVARRAGVRVLETPVAGKVNALRLGEAACRTFPRVYLDADKSGTLTAGDLSAFGGAVPSIALSDPSGGVALTVGSDNTSTTFAGSMSDAAGGPGSVVKVGTGTQTLTGTDSANSTVTGSTSFTVGAAATSTFGMTGGDGAAGVACRVGPDRDWLHRRLRADGLHVAAELLDLQLVDVGVRALESAGLVTVLRHHVVIQKGRDAHPAMLSPARRASTADNW